MRKTKEVAKRATNAMDQKKKKGKKGAGAGAQAEAGGKDPSPEQCFSDGFFGSLLEYDIVIVHPNVCNYCVLGRFFGELAASFDLREFGH